DRRGFIEFQRESRRADAVGRGVHETSAGDDAVGAARADGAGVRREGGTDSPSARVSPGDAPDDALRADSNDPESVRQKPRRAAAVFSGQSYVSESCKGQAL